MTTPPPISTTALAVPEHAIRCTWCQAPPGHRCTTRGRPLSILSHQTRIDDWATAAAAAVAAPQPEGHDR